MCCRVYNVLYNVSCVVYPTVQERGGAKGGKCPQDKGPPKGPRAGRGSILTKYLTNLVRRKKLFLNILYINNKHFVSSSHLFYQVMVNGVQVSPPLLATAGTILYGTAGSILYCTALTLVFGNVLHCTVQY